MSEIKATEFSYQNLHDELVFALDDATEDDTAALATVAIRVFRRALLNRAIEILRGQSTECGILAQVTCMVAAPVNWSRP